jgi:hypothetical protein
MVTASRIKYLAKYEAQAAAITAKFTDYKLGKNQPARKVPARGASVGCSPSQF